ncbi:alpha/beta fold hydrolase [Kribbella sp. NPDC051586]|uniref:alpha/beta fold hydrolase n=1 Tax=Kribbella sp. NPDC051586 TaxID=3364118 RepID=UPI0037B5F5E1
MESIYSVNDLELCAETYGDPADPAVLLIHGATASMLWWDSRLCTDIAARGRFVIRYDQRDTGRSTSFPVGAPGYAMSDLAADAVGLLDALGIERADVVAQSMSGGTALILGVDHPDRVASLTLVSTSTGDEGLPPPSPDMPHLGTPDFDAPTAVEEYVVRAIEAEAAGHFDESAARALVVQDMARTRNYEAAMTNHYAMTFDAPRNGSFADLTMPVLVMHGDADPLLPLPHGEAVRDAVPGARLVVLEGMGHGLSAPYWKAFVDEVVAR